MSVFVLNKGILNIFSRFLRQTVETRLLQRRTETPPVQEEVVTQVCLTTTCIAIDPCNMLPCYSIVKNKKTDSKLN